MGDVLGIKEDILGLRSALGDDVRCGIKEDAVGSLEDIVRCGEIKEDVVGSLEDIVRCGEIKEDVVGSLEDIVIPDIEGSLRTQCRELCPV